MVLFLSYCRKGGQVLCIPDITFNCGNVDDGWQLDDFGEILHDDYGVKMKPPTIEEDPT